MRQNDQVKLKKKNSQPDTLEDSKVRWINANEAYRSQEHWTIERTVDELAYCLCSFKISAVACSVDYDNNNNHQKNNENGNEIHIANKYIEQAEQNIYRILAWRPAPRFVVNLSDLTQRIKKDLLYLLRVKAFETLNYIIQHAIAVVFEGIDERYFHLNIGAGRITWRLDP